MTNCVVCAKEIGQHCYQHHPDTQSFLIYQLTSLNRKLVSLEAMLTDIKKSLANGPIATTQILEEEIKI